MHANHSTEHFRQGVGYRRWFAEQAITPGLKGYVKNLSSGEVEAVMIGTDVKLQEMIARSW
jgi:acylphosphatase